MCPCPPKPTPPSSSRLTAKILKALQGPDWKNVLESNQIPWFATDVFIAGSGPIGATYAREILRAGGFKVTMAEIGAQNDPIIGRHLKNSVGYQKEFNSFVHVVRGALQPLSIPYQPSDTHVSTLIGDAWRPQPDEELIFANSNPDQDPATNLGAAAATRTVGGMATHWTCCCPRPHEDESKKNPISKDEFQCLLDDAEDILHVNTRRQGGTASLRSDNGDQKTNTSTTPFAPPPFDRSMRHRIVLQTLQNSDNFRHRNIGSLPLAVELRKDNPIYRTWSAVDTILGDVKLEENFTLLTEHRVTSVLTCSDRPSHVRFCLVRDFNKDRDVIVVARAVVLASGAISTPQILANSGLGGNALGRYLCEHSLAFCQVALKRDIVRRVHDHKDFEAQIKHHQETHTRDPLPIPFTDFEPQVYVPYTPGFPHHGQVHRDAFSYGLVRPSVDCRVIVDLRFFGKQDVRRENRVTFAFNHALPNGDAPDEGIRTRPRPGGRSCEGGECAPGSTDMYGMPQPTFHVTRSPADSVRDQFMMNDMTNAANELGAYLPGSYPQFMEPGTAQHITGTTRIGERDDGESVADANSKVHKIENLWVGGNGNIPDSAACNPTLTSMAIALKSARAVVEYLRSIR